jgi:hypothetical protein
MRDEVTKLIQPEDMKTRSYVYGVEKLNGYDAWALFKACGLGDMGKDAPGERPAAGQRATLVSAPHPQRRERGPHGDGQVAAGTWRGPRPIALYLRFVGQVAGLRPGARASPDRIAAPARDAKAVQLFTGLRCAPASHHREEFTRHQHSIAATAKTHASGRCARQPICLHLSPLLVTGAK